MLRIPNESREPGMVPFRAAPAQAMQPPPSQVSTQRSLQDRRLTVLMEEASFDEEQARAILGADKVLIGDNWFCLLDGELTGGPVNADGTLNFAYCAVIDMPDHFEYADITRRAELMLGAVAHGGAA